MRVVYLILGVFNFYEPLHLSNNLFFLEKVPKASVKQPLEILVAEKALL